MLRVICSLFLMSLMLGSCTQKIEVHPVHYSYPYDAAALMWTKLDIKALEQLIDLIEQRLHAQDLETYLNVQTQIDNQLAALLAAIDLNAGITVYGDPGFAHVELRAVRTLFGFTRTTTLQDLERARQIVEETKRLIATQ